MYTRAYCVVQDGTYLRNGPGVWDLGGCEFRHLFDGYATLVRVSFRGAAAEGAHRQVESDAYKAARAHGRPRHREFSEVPEPDGLVQVLARLAGLALLGAPPLTDNANAGALALGDGRVLCTSETASSWTLVDPDTLGTVGRFRFADRLGGLVQSPHPVVGDAAELWALVPDLLRRGYLVVRMEAGRNEREVVARVACRGRSGVGWVHSFPVTERYVVVPEMPLRYSARSFLRAAPEPRDMFDWRPECGSYMHVVCRATGKTVASVEVPPFVAFHYINAYEETGADGRATAVVVDCSEHYADASVLARQGRARLPQVFHRPRRAPRCESGAVQDTARRRGDGGADDGTGPGGARPSTGHVQHQPGVPRQAVPVRVRLRHAPAVQLLQRANQDRPGGEEGHVMVRGRHGAVGAAVRGQARGDTGGRRRGDISGERQGRVRLRGGAGRDDVPGGGQGQVPVRAALRRGGSGRTVCVWGLRHVLLFY